MGTHPIFESDFDCLTEHRIMHRLVQKQLIRPRRALSKSPNQDPVRVEVRGRVMLIMLNRASKMNAIDHEMSEQLYSTMRAFENMSHTAVAAAVLCSIKGFGFLLPSETPSPGLVKDHTFPLY